MRVAVELAEMTDEPAYTINQFVRRLAMSGYFLAPACHETLATFTVHSLGSSYWPLGTEASAQDRPSPTVEFPYFVGVHVFEGRYESALPRLVLGAADGNEEVACRW